MISYWESKAKGGVGIVTSGVQGVPHHSLASSPFAQPGAVDAYKRAADRVKRHGTCFLVQLWHPGSSAGWMLTGKAGWSSSAVPGREGSPVPHAVTRDEIKEIVEAYAAAAAIVKESGADGVDIHGAHGYLLNQFMSPRTNKRDDEYGGSVEGRMRLTLEVIEAVRAVAGSDFAVGIRVTADQFSPDGYTLDHMTTMASMMASTGKLDYLLMGPGIPAMYFPLGAFVYWAATLKQAVDIPVIASGRINDPAQAEKILADGQADLVAMNRATICDPELPNKAREGRLEEIRTCLACSEGCWQTLAQDRNPNGITCAYNPVVGKESLPGWLELIPAEVRKKVMVIGGGPAGLETARVAAARGHQVSIWEKADDLGGMVLVAARAPRREEMGEVARYYRYQMKLLGVDGHLNTEATVGTVEEENPDVVVVATGSVPRVPYDIPGIDQQNVVDNVRDVLTGKAEVGQSVVIIDAQRHIQGLGTADFLVEQGKKVELVTRDPAPGEEMEGATRIGLLTRLHRAGVKLTPSTRLKEVSGSTVTLENVFTGEESVIDNVDTVVLSYGGVERNDLYYALRTKVKEIYSVGDCNGVRKLKWATNDGATIARMI
jgi:2,4-dienoyl-CoA reductase-like NADH-dependent reductase (Old Yellow Enzyme family)/thioredoxin reductase